MHVEVHTSEIQHLTCTADSISSVAKVTGAGVTPLCVSALCPLMTVVEVITLTFINVCMKVERVPYKVSVQPTGYLKDIICYFHY